MDILVDSSVVFAVILGRPEREQIVPVTKGRNLAAPGSLPWEIGDSFHSMLRQEQLSLEEVKRGLAIFHSINIQYLSVNLENAVSIANKYDLGAYEAYYVDCALRLSAPLLTLNPTLRQTADKMGVHILEVN